jgi:hypothetical protein
MKPDLVLEGARREELDMLRRIRDGQLPSPDERLETLQSKGWLDLCNGTALLTLSGRTLVDSAAQR